MYAIKKKEVNSCIFHSSDPIALKYRNIRTSINTVRTAFHKTVDILISKHHCSKRQAVAAVMKLVKLCLIVTTGNIMIKTHPNLCGHSTTQQKHSKSRRSYSCFGLGMSCGGNDAVITYHSDGSRVQGTGGYIVQGITIIGTYRRLPALPISSECRSNLSLLKETVFTILCSRSGVPIHQLFQKIPYQMTDATSHNLKVDEMVALDLGVDCVPEYLFCQTHPCLMFNREVLEVF